jgi:predicted nucleic acid-binding protein
VDFASAVDDRRASRLARERGVVTVGTVATLVDAKISGLIVSVRPLLGALQSNGFRVGERIINQALQLAGEESRGDR